MKRIYEAPVLKLEAFVLNDTIAVGCTEIIGIQVHDENPACKDSYPDPGDIPFSLFGTTPSGVTSADPNVCDCENTAFNPGVTLMTS